MVFRCDHVRPVYTAEAVTDGKKRKAMTVNPNNISTMLRMLGAPDARVVCETVRIGAGWRIKG